MDSRIVSDRWSWTAVESPSSKHEQSEGTVCDGQNSSRHRESVATRGIYVNTSHADGPASAHRDPLHRGRPMGARGWHFPAAHHDAPLAGRQGGISDRDAKQAARTPPRRDNRPVRPGAGSSTTARQELARPQSQGLWPQVKAAMCRHMTVSVNIAEVTVPAHLR